MSSHTLISSLRVQSWRRKAIKQQLLSSVWDQLSNRVNYNDAVPAAKTKMAPDQLIHKVKDSFDEGTQTTTIPWIGKLNANPLGGPNKAEGNERRLTTLMRRVPYNVQRQPIIINDQSVDGDLTKFYRMAEQAVDRVKDSFVETTDWNSQRAILEGADWYLTDESNWTGAEPASQLSAPESTVMHPNAYVDGTAAKLAWSSTYATAESTLQTAGAALATTNVFDLNALDRIALLASRNVLKMSGGVKGAESAKFVLKISDAQWYQLSTESSTGWRDMLKHTAEGYKRMIDGAQGTYKDMMLLVDQRAPIYDLAASAGSRFKYATAAADNRTRVQKTNSAADGTLEIAVLGGAGMLGKAEVKELDFTKKGFDYDFSTGSCGMRAEGTVRMDLDSGSTPTSARRCESSFVFYTVSTTETIG
jgi:hypothetical protein